MIRSDLLQAYGDQLLFVGLTGSRATHQKPDADLDVLAIVDEEADGDVVNFYGDLKIVSASGIRTFMEHGYQLVGTQVRKAVPLFEKENGIIDPFREIKPQAEKALPFLVAKSHFNEQTADILHLTSNKCRAILMHQLGYVNEAFEQLNGRSQDETFSAIEAASSGLQTYAELARYYANLGLNRMFHSISEMLQAIHIQREGDVADVEDLIAWSLREVPGAGAIFQQTHQARIECYKQGRLLLDAEFELIREGVRRQNSEIEPLIKG